MVRMLNHWRPQVVPSDVPAGKGSRSHTYYRSTYRVKSARALRSLVNELHDIRHQNGLKMNRLISPLPNLPR